MVLLLVGSAAAQVKIGDDVGLSANGTVSGGYSGSYGSDVQSGHGFTVGGTANVNGYYYSPNFFSFDVIPFYNESRTNSSFQSITDSTGVQFSSHIFAGSHFPGSISYTRNYNKEGAFALPGQGDLVTHANGQAFNITWSENLPDVPSVTAGFTKGDSSYSVFGTNNSGRSSSDSLFIHSSYLLDGFNLGGGYSQSTGHATVPELFSGQGSQESTGNNKNFNFSVSHLLPLHGNGSLSFNRNYLNNDYLGYKFNGTIDTVNLGVGIAPTQKWNIGVSGSYTDNLSGQLYQATIPTGAGSAPANGSSAPPVGAIAGTQTSNSSHAWDLEMYTSYALAPNLLFNGEAARREQTFAGASFGSDLFGGGLLYSRPWLGGYVSANGFVSDNRVDFTGANYLSFSSNGSFTRAFGAWRTAVSGSYSQNTQSALIAYTTSNYTLNGNAGRRLGNFFWTVGAGLSHSVLTAQPHTRYASQSYSTGIGYRNLSVQGNYAHSDGNGLITGAGLTPGPLPPIIPASLLILYGGSSYGFAFSGSPLKRLTFSATYNKAFNNTTSQGVFSNNHLEERGLFVQYQFRKVGVSGGYSRLAQGISAASTHPTDFSSFSISLYRWFNFF